MTETLKLDIEKIREQFPVLKQKVYGKTLVYFDNAATSQKPLSVIEALSGYYLTTNSNIHRGAHALANHATGLFEDTREAARKFIGAGSVEEVIFTKGTTEGINLVAATYGRKFIGAGDEIIVTGMEHHSNIVPWQLLCEEKGATLKAVPVNAQGEIDLEDFKKLLSDKTKFVSVVHVSNALGTINPVREIIALAHERGVPVMLDGAQSVLHLDINVEELDCDFYAFSAHKVYGPTGVGILYGKKELLEKMPPYMGGGEMIAEVSFEKTTFNVLPYKFEAGTPNIADIIALKAAFEFVEGLGKANMAAHEQELLQYATAKLLEIKGIKIIGTAKNKISVISFIAEGAHHYDLGMMLDTQGVAVRTGHHCTQPLMKSFGLEGTLRVSFAVYNTIEEVDMFIAALKKSLSIIVSC